MIYLLCNSKFQDLYTSTLYMLQVKIKTLVDSHAGFRLCPSPDYS